MKTNTLFAAMLASAALLSASASYSVYAQENQVSRAEPKLMFCQKGLEKMGQETSVQGMAIHGDYMFSLRNKGVCVVMDLKKQALVSEFKLASYGENNHANNAFFSKEKYDKSDRFPLLYVSQCRSLPVDEIGIDELKNMSRLLFVERILTDEDGNPVGSQLVQVISYKQETFMSNLWLFDPKNPDYVFCYGNTKGNALPDNRIVVHRFSFPKFDKNDFIVKLSPEDVQYTFYIDETLPEGSRGPQDNILQAGCIYDGILYMPVGVGKEDRPSELYVVKLFPIKNEIPKGYRFEYTDVIPCEMEDVDVWKKKLICVTNSKGKRRPVYEFSLKELKQSIK
ncbi:MAG: hypothetical protein K5984_05050 [Bacteroidales bacterium]|nr:hypothetical protein [Bacteroidales bacterium]